MAAQRGLIWAAARGKRSSACPRTTLWFAQMLFTPSGYLNSKARLVKAYLHFHGHEESDGRECVLTTSF